MNIVTLLLLKEIVQEMLQIKVDVSCRLKNGLSIIYFDEKYFEAKYFGGKYFAGNILLVIFCW